MEFSGVRDFNQGFFSSPLTTASIQDLVSAPSITLFVGAGASRDVGIPTWAALVNDLLHEYADRRHPDLPIELRQQVVKALLDRNFESAVATIIDSLIPEPGQAERAPGAAGLHRLRNQAIAARLYADSGRGFGMTLAREIVLTAIVLAACDKDVHILTTNYDTTMESVAELDHEARTTLEQYGLRMEQHSTAPPRASAAPSTIPLVHIHGLIPRKGEASGVVFSELDYIDWMDNNPIRDYIHARLSGPTLIIGASLRDYNILTYLKRASVTSAKRFAVLPVEGDLPGLDREALSVYASIQSARGRHLGIKILQPDFFGQVMQYLVELRHAAAGTAIGKYEQTRYVCRVDQWHSFFHDDASKTAARKRRADANKLSALAARLATEIRDVEHAKVEVWIRGKAEDRCLTLWATSQSIALEDTASYWPHSSRIEHLSQAPAVVTFRSRQVTRARVTTRTDGRWTHYVSVPVILEDPPHNGIPVGCVIAFVHAGKYEGKGNFSALQSAEVWLTEEMIRVGTGMLR